MKAVIEPSGITVLHEGWSGSNHGSSSSSRTSRSSEPQTDFDVIAVHGMFSQGFDPWISEETSGKNTMWVRDKLFEVLPDARIMSFGYDCSDTPQAASPKSSISDIALDLLAALATKRTVSEEQKRPIIFIAHELGGIIVKQALLHAKYHSQYHPIEKQTCRLLFFGTPHRAATYNEWENILFEIAISSTGKSRYKNATFIKSITQVVWNVSVNFYSIFGMYGFIFVENKSSEKSIVIKRYVATSDLSWDIFNVKESSPSDLCKVPNWDIGEIILDEFSTGPQQFDPDYRECRRGLWDLCPPVKLTTKYHGNFDWLTSDSKYEFWFETNEPAVLIVHGKHEIQLSETYSFLVQHLCSQEDQFDFRVTHFSFDSTDCRKSSTTSLMVSLALQILSSASYFFNSTTVQKFYRKLNEPPRWAKSKIWDLFTSLLTSNTNLGTKIICVVHALDECDNSRKSFMRDLRIFTQFNIVGFKFVFIGKSVNETTAGGFVADFPHVTAPNPIQGLNGMGPEQRVCQLIEQRPDYLVAKQELLDLFNQFSASTDVLWPKLVMGLLASTNLRATRSIIRNHIQSLPQSYHEFLDRILLSVPSWAEVAFSWVLHAACPLKLDELAVAVSLGHETQTLTHASIQDNMPHDISKDIKDVFGPLIKLEDSEILLVHRYIREVLQERDKSKNRNQRFSINRHWEIAERCLSYLSLEAVENPSIDPLNPQNSSALLEYAASYWPLHYRKSPKDDESRKRILDFLGNGPAIEKWLELKKRFKKPNSRHLDVHSPILIASQQGLDDVVATLLYEPGNKITIAERGDALKLAAERIHLDVMNVLLAYPIDGAAITEVLYDSAVQQNDDALELLVEYMSKSELELDIPPVCFFRAAGTNNLDLAQKLQAAGADINVTHEESTLLHLASKYGHQNFLQYLLENEVSLNMRDSIGATPLFLAVQGRHIAIVSDLIHAKVDVNQPVLGLGFSPLHCAIRDGDTNIVKLLIEAGADPYAIWEKDQSQSSHIACLYGHLSIVELLLEANVDFNSGDGSGETPLMIACTHGHDEIVQKLILHGVPLDVTDNYGNTALYKAITSHSLSIARRLLDANASTNLEKNSYTTLLIESIQAKAPVDFVDLLLWKGALPEVLDIAGQSVIHHVAISGDDAVLESFLKTKPDVMLTDKTLLERTALHYAAKWGNYDVLRILLEHGADARALDKKGRSGLHLAAKRGDARIVQLLLAETVDLDLRDGPEEQTALHLASKKGHVEIVRLLIDGKCNINAVDIRGATALHLAILFRHCEVFNCLKQNGADLNIKDRSSRSLLHYAAKNENTKLLQMSLSDIADLEAEDENGFTALYIATDNSNLDAVRVLLDHKANPNCTDHDLKTPIYIATRLNNPKIVQLLLAVGAKVDPLGEYGYSPLHLACSRNHEDIALLLLQAKHPTEILDEDDWTPFHVAAMNGHDNLLETLNKYHANLTAKAKDGRTALHFAFDEINSAKWLLSHEIDVDPMDNEGRTPLMLAVQRCIIHMVEFFLDNNADPNLRDNQGRSSLHYISEIEGDGKTVQIAHLLLQDKKSNVNQLDNNAMSIISKLIEDCSIDLLQLLVDSDANQEVKNKALLIAVKVGPINKVEILLNAKANVNTKNQEEMSALMLAVEDSEEEIAILLVNNGADLSDDGPAALCSAAETSQEKLVQRLLEKGVDANATRFDSYSALQAAIESNSKTTITMLIEKNADLNTMVGNREGYPVNTSILNNQWVRWTMRLFFGKGADKNNVDRQGRLAMHHAAYRGSMEAFEWLGIASGQGKPEIFSKDLQGRNVLHHAASGGERLMVSYLAEFRTDTSYYSYDKNSHFDVNSVDDDGWTALHWACRAKNPKTIQILLTLGADPTRTCKRNWTPRHVATFHDQEELVSILDKEISKRGVESGSSQKIAKGEFGYPSFFCDGCQLDIYGIRFECLICYEFDFCFKCYWTVKKTHPPHEFKRIGNGPVEGPIFVDDSSD